MSVSTIINVTEQVLHDAVLSCLTAQGITMSVYVGDEATVKGEMPYVIVACDGEVEEQEGPGTGIYKIPCNITYRSHVKLDSTATRDAVLNALDGIAYAAGGAIAFLNTVNANVSGLGFHCYGFMPVVVSRRVNTELKCYEYVNAFVIIGMPRLNV